MRTKQARKVSRTVRRAEQGDSIWEYESVSNVEVANCLLYELSLSLDFSPFCEGCPKSVATLVILQSK